MRTGRAELGVDAGSVVVKPWTVELELNRDADRIEVQRCGCEPVSLSPSPKPSSQKLITVDAICVAAPVHRNNPRPLALHDLCPARPIQPCCL
ncbi:hypothetical protein M0R45_009610 [Rubus argutus]|uniref:Uncharacterized protein n=1 Tax=Rubus argutus TaxID=59490 RepID=A0AAW1Y476_RUBAR